ncbi:MAG: molecular chaperone DnaJ [Halobacteriales archaeon]
MSEDFYAVLGVDRDATEEEITRAFRKKAAKYHPDVSDEPDAEETFKRVKKAKEVLTDEEKRQLYDQLGHERYLEYEKTGAADQGGAHAGGPFGGGDPFGGGPFGDIFEQFFGGGRAGRERSRRRQGTTLRTELTIDLEAAFEGTTKRITVRRPEACDTCGGSGHAPGADVRTCAQCNGQGRITEVRRSAFGQVQQSRPCPRCDGEGRIVSEACPTCAGDGIVEREATLEVEVPAGIRDGQTLRMRGEGAPGEGGGPPGDLLIEVRVTDHPDFDRDGDDLRYDLELSIPQAALGDRVVVPTLDGEVELRVPAGTQPGDRFRLDDRGMPRLEGRGRGDLIVEVDVRVPTELTEEQREALQALAGAMDEELDVDASLFDRIRGSF